MIPAEDAFGALCLFAAQDTISGGVGSRHPRQYKALLNFLQNLTLSAASPRRRSETIAAKACSSAAVQSQTSPPR